MVLQNHQRIKAHLDTILIFGLNVTRISASSRFVKLLCLIGEQILNLALFTGTKIVTTDGGRFDVDIEERKRTPAYWIGESNEVRRCSWFYKGKDFRLIPYEEDVAEQLEEEYKDAAHTGEWQRKIPLTSGETVVFNGPSDILHFLKSESTDAFNNAMVSLHVA